MDTWLVVGLGNPGPAYAGNRHNVGAMTVEEVAGRGVGGRASFKAHKAARARVAETRLSVGGPKVVLAVPSLFMNESGSAVAGLAKYYDVPPDHVVVLQDGLDINAGWVGLKLGGGGCAHTGLVSVSLSLGTRDFLRFFFNDAATPEIYALSLHVALPFSTAWPRR